MENLGAELPRQNSLFNNRQSPSLFFVTSTRNLMSFLGAGMLTPADCQFRYKEDSREAYQGAIPFWKGGVPSHEPYGRTLKDEKAIVVECRTDDVLRYAGRFIIAENEQLLVANAPIPLVSVVAFHAKSDSVVDDFISRVPADVLVEKSIFKIGSLLEELPLIDEPVMTNMDSIQPELAFIDSLGGGLKALLEFMSEDITNYQYIRDILALCFESGRAVNGEDQANETRVDRAILSALLPILCKLKPENGLDPVSLLDELVTALNYQDDDIKSELDKWSSYAKKAVENEIAPPPLADERGVLQRGVLLFLLRPDLDRLKKAKSSSNAPGPVVISIAALLAGFTNGLTRMGPEYKGNYRDFNLFTKALLDSLWGKSERSIKTIREASPNYGELEVYEINKEVLFKLVIRPNAVLMRVLNQARSLGVSMNYDYKNHQLYQERDMGNERSQKVYIELITPLKKGLDVLRFVSPCMDLSGKNSKSLKKNTAIDFLKRNYEDSMYCAFAYSEKRQAIVAEAMQIVGTMDDDELIALLESVAKVADEYERDVLGHDKY
jgi:hypothetical protein